MSYERSPVVDFCDYGYCELDEGLGTQRDVYRRAERQARPSVTRRPRLRPTGNLYVRVTIPGEVSIPARWVTVKLYRPRRSSLLPMPLWDEIDRTDLERLMHNPGLWSGKEPGKYKLKVEASGYSAANEPVFLWTGDATVYVKLVRPR